MLTSKSRLIIFTFCLLSIAVTTSCRYDMQDQPKLGIYKESDWFKDGRASREAPEGTIARGQLRENKSLYSGKLENPTGTAQTNAAGQQITFPDVVSEFPMAVTQEVVDRGQERFKIYCQICHGAFGNGDGMAVRRGFPKPPSYNDDRLRNAPVGHFFDVATKGWGKMNGYASQVSVADRWAIVAYIRALQLSQNPNGAKTAVVPTSANTATPTASTPMVEPTMVPTTTPSATQSATPIKPVATPAVKPTVAATAKPIANPVAKPTVAPKPVGPISNVKTTTPSSTKLAGGNSNNE